MDESYRCNNIYPTPSSNDTPNPEYCSVFFLSNAFVVLYFLKF